jgi:hypothetical protein
MPKIPNSWPPDSPRCDPRLPQAALQFRRDQAPPLTTLEALGAINVTAWLYQVPQSREDIQVNPNTTIAELRQEFGPSDVEVGFHSEGHAAEWFRVRPHLKVLAIFTERKPCRMMCAPLLEHYFPGVPVYYYYDRGSWRGEGGELLRSAAEALRVAYGL